MPRLRRSILVLAAAGAACAAPQEPWQPPPVPPQDGARPYDVPATFGRQFQVEATAIPAAWMTRDGDGGAPDVDAEDVVGYGLRGAIGRADRSVGLLWQGFHSDGDVFDAQLLGFDLDVRTRLEEGGDAFFLRAAAGLGTAWLDDPVDGSRDAEMAAQLRLGFDFEPVARFRIGASVGGLLVGHPGDLVAFGTFVGFEATLVF